MKEATVRRFLTELGHPDWFDAPRRWRR
jgi:hypothetical protein